MFRSYQFMSLFAALALGACIFGGDEELPVQGEPVPPPNADPLLGCNGVCHGDEYSTAPPKGLQGETDTALRAVGAHRSHLNPSPTWYLKVGCSDCHAVPQNVDSPGHIDGDGQAELTFGARATGDGTTNPTWDGYACSNVACHGANLNGGIDKNPNWTELDGSQSACGTCHGFPPPAPHPDDANCGGCHPTIQPGTTFFLDPYSHINGKVEKTVDNNVQGCNACHGGADSYAPPQDLAGNVDYTYSGVGAHQAHLGVSDWHAPLNCTQCHVYPDGIDAPGHRDGDGQAEIYFDGLNPQANYDFAQYQCTNLYCHSNGWNQLATMTWTENLDLGCTSCHDTAGLGMSGEHDFHITNKGNECTECHTTVVDAGRNFINPQYHIDGVHEVYFLQGGAWDAANKQCINVACHNNRKW